jgi:hypothetical protein
LDAISGRRNGFVGLIARREGKWQGSGIRRTGIGDQGLERQGLEISDQKSKFGAHSQRARAESSLGRGLAVIATVIAAVAAAAAISGEGVLIVRIMIAGACMASPIARFVAVEVIEGLFAALWIRSMVAVAGVEAVIDMAVELAGAAEPAPSADKDSILKPIGPIVAVRRAVIRSVVVVAIGAHRLHSEIDGDLGRRYARRAKQGGCESCESDGSNLGHNLSLIGFLRGGSFACELVCV